MADMFYFCSPRKQLPPRQVKYRPSCRGGRGKTAGRRPKTDSRMEVLTQRACMARFDEPVFCPSVSLPFSASSAQHSWTSSTTLDAAFSDDDDEAGGVPIPVDDEDDEMSDAHTDATQATASNAHAQDPDLLLNDGHGFRERRTTRPVVHSRPHSPSTTLEEESRRLRIALEDDTPSSPRWQDPTFHPDFPLIEAFPPSSNHGDSSTHLQTANDAPAIYHTSHDHIEERPYVDPTHAHQMHHTITNIDPEALAVDHPWRNYDVADFFETWRSEALSGTTLPPISYDAPSGLDGWEQPSDVQRRHATGATDMQGICWPEFGTTRDNAVRARESLHPSKPLRLSQMSMDPDDSTAERLFRFHRFNSRHRASFCHYQLRQVLTASSRNNIFYASGSRVMQASLSCPTLATPVLDFTRHCSTAAPFRTTCLATTPSSSFPEYQNYNVLLAGGFYGEYALLNLNAPSSTQIEGFVTHAYNGLVTHVDAFSHRRSGLPQAAFCSNDHKIRILDINSQRFVSEFAYPSALNCSAISQDGRLRALAGDSCETLITDAEKGTVLTTLNAHLDHSFAVAWAQNGINMATAAQDGRTLIWDARNWSAPIRDLGCRMSCPRSLRWTEDDTLVVAEEDDVVHFYGGKGWKTRQEVRFFGAVAGMAVLGGGEEVVIANADRSVGGLMVFERSRGDRRRLKDWDEEASALVASIVI